MRPHVHVPLLWYCQGELHADVKFGFPQFTLDALATSVVFPSIFLEWLLL